MGFLNHQQYGPNPLRHDIDHQLPDQLELVVAMDSHISVFLPKKTTKNSHQQKHPCRMPEVVAKNHAGIKFFKIKI